MIVCERLRLDGPAIVLPCACPNLTSNLGYLLIPHSLQLTNRLLITDKSITACTMPRKTSCHLPSGSTMPPDRTDADGTELHDPGP